MASKSSSSSGFDNLPLFGKIFILVLLLGIVTAIWYFAMYMPLSEELTTAETEYTRLQGQMREAEQRQQEYLRLTQELASREAIDRQNKRVLPEEAEIPAFLQDLNRVAELSGLGVRLVEPRPEQNEELYVRLPVQLQVTGRFHQLAKFFYNISRLERAINMENISLSEPTTAEESGEVVLKVNVLATTFRRPSEEQPAGAAVQQGGAQ